MNIYKLRIILFFMNKNSQDRLNSLFIYKVQ